MVNSSIILGIGGALGHDANVALILNGQLISASQEERFTRVKHEWNFPRMAVSDCLASAGLQPEQVQVVAFAEKPLQSLVFDTAGRPTSRITWLLARFARDKWIQDSFFPAQPWCTMNYMREARQMFPSARFLFSWHHEAHAAAAFATSAFEQAAFLCVDGKGEDISASVGIATPDRTQILYELPYENGLGLLYTLVTNYLGFSTFGSEYKVMGLAPYGEPSFVKKLRGFTTSDADGALRLVEHANFSPTSMCNAVSALEQHLCVPSRGKQDPLSDAHINIAASLQAIFEEEILKMVNFARRITKQDSLLFCGGCAQNCVAAGRIKRSGHFQHVFTSPVSGDMGNALGAALLAHRQLSRNSSGKVNANGFYLGPEPGEIPPEAAQYRISAEGESIGLPLAW